jgi:diphosphomevalonate decarboxylase
MLSRRGSGSAARSVSGGFMYWDSTHAIRIDTDWELADTIVILSTAEKNISSTDGHALALTSPHFAQRQVDLPERTASLCQTIQAKDFHRFGQIIEAEALEMHHIAETSMPPINYLSEDSRRLVRAIQSLPERFFYFTIDAGPNLHLISERSDQPRVVEFLKKWLPELQLKAEIWVDGLGTGPSLE